MTMQVSETNAASPPCRPLVRRLLRGLGTAAGGSGLALLTAWAAAALYFDVRVPWLRVLLTVIYLLLVVGVWLIPKRRWLGAVLTTGCFALVLAWWFALQPSNDRTWQPDVAVLA